MRLGHRLEDVGHGFGAVERHLGLVAVGVNRRHILAVHGRGAVFGDEIHQPRDADVFFRRDGEEGDEQFLLHGGMDAGAEFLLRQAALLEILVHQRVVGFGDVLDEFAVQRFDPFAHSPVAGSSVYLPEPSVA